MQTWSIIFTINFLKGRFFCSCQQSVIFCTCVTAFLTRSYASSDWKAGYFNDISSTDFTKSYFDQALNSFSLKNVTLSCNIFVQYKCFPNLLHLEISAVLEDDSILTSSARVYNLLDQLSDRLDQNIPFFLDISNSLNLSSIYSNKFTSRQTDGFFRALCGQTRCASAYVLNYSAASLISSSSVSLSFPLIGIIHIFCAFIIYLLFGAGIVFLCRVPNPVYSLVIPPLRSSHA